MLRVFSLFTLLASANVFAIGDSNITLSDGVLVTDHFHWDLGDEWEIDSERDSGFNLNYDEKFSVYLKSGESTIQISLYVDDLSISDYSDNLARELDYLIPYSDDVLMHSEYFLTNDFIHSGVLERYKSDTNKYYSIIDATTTGFDGNSSNEWVNFSAIIEGDNLILADVVELIKRVDFLEDSLEHFSIPAVANLDNGESNVTYHIGETNLKLTTQGVGNNALTLSLYNFDNYEDASWEELSIIDDQTQTTAILENPNGDTLTFNDFGDVSMDEYWDALLEYERSQTNKTIEDYGLFLTDHFEIGFGIHLSEDQAGTPQHEYLFVIDAGQDEDANTWRYIEIRLFSSALSFHDAYEMIGRTKENYASLINSEKKEALVNLLTSMVAPLDDLDSTKPKVLKFTTEDIIDTSNSDQITRIGISSTVFAVPLLDHQISLRYTNLNDALFSEQNVLTFYDSNISNLSSFVTETGFNAYTFEVSHEPTFSSPAQVEHRSIVDLSSATLITGKETIDSAVIYHRYDQKHEELTPYFNETLNSIAVTSFEENVDELQEEIGELPDITDISLLEVVEDGPISFSIPADLNVSNTISFKSDPLTSVLAEYRLNTGDVYSSPDIVLSFGLLDMEDLDSYLNPLKFDSDYTTVDTFRTFITSNNYDGAFVNGIWDRDLQDSYLILIFDQQEIVEKLPDGTFLGGQVFVGNLDTNISSSTLLAIADSIKINPDKIPAFLDPLDQETGELPDTSFISLPQEIADGPVKFSVPADLGFSSYSSYNSSSPFYIEPDQNGLLAKYNLNKLSISLKYTQKDLKDEMLKILPRAMDEDYSILLNQSFTTSNNYNGHITELNSTSGSKTCIIAVDITSDEIISKIPKDSKLILTAQSYGDFSNDILMAIVNSFQLDPSLSIQDLHPPLALNSKFTDGPITICLPDNWIVDPKKAYTERENLSHAQYAFYERSGLSTGVFLNIDSGSLANNLDDWGAQYLHSYQSSQLNRGSVASHYLSSRNQLFKGISVSRHYPTLLTNLNLLGLSSDFWIGMDITTSEWKTRHLRNQYAKDSDWLKAFIVAENSLYYNTALEIIKCLDFNHSNYQEIPPFKENNSTVTSSSGDANGYPIIPQSDGDSGYDTTSQSSAFLDGSILFITSNDPVKLTLFLENGSGTSIFENPDDNEYVVESGDTYTVEEGPDSTYKITLSDGDFLTFDPSSGTGSLTDFSNGQIDESGSWDFSFERFDWEKYDDFSESSLDLTKWEVGYFAGGQEVTIENGQAKLSGSAYSPNSAIQMPSDLAAAGDGATEGNTFLFFKDQEIHGIQADIYLPAENNSYEAGVYLTSIDTNPLGSLGAELRNKNTGAVFLFDCFDDYGKESEYQTNGALGTFHQVRITKIDGKTSYFLDDNLIKQFASSSHKEDYWAIGALNDNGAAYTSYADNVRVLRRSGKSSSVSSGYAPDSISGFSVISTGSDGTQYDPLVFSNHGIASREYADRDYQYEKTSSTQGKITYSFTGEDDDKPEVAIVTFSSLNEGTYLWTEYADSALQTRVDTDQGSWKMIPGYERTADSQNPDLAPDSLTGLLAEYTSTNDSSSEIIYFSNDGTATAHSDGRMYSYEKISDNQGIITYSFENEAVPKPEITNITFTSLNGGTFTWAEYSDSTMKTVLDSDSGTWIMTPGYERTAEGSPSQSSGNVMSKWVESGWLGVFFEASNGWIYHPELGWMYAENSSADKTWLYSDKKGWLWTSKNAYPHLYSDNSSNWVYIASDQDTPTKAFDYNPKKWTLWQDLTLNRMVQPSPEKLSTSSADEKKVYEIINSNASNKDKLNRIAEAIRSKL